MKRNPNYNPDIIIASKESVEAIHLSGIGRFCLCGCGKRINRQIIKRNVKGKIVIQNRLRNDQKYATPACKTRYYNKLFGKTQNSSVRTLIFLKVNDGTKPYREMRLYLKKGISKTIRITKDNKELWQVLDAIAGFRKIKSNPMINHETVARIAN